MSRRALLGTVGAGSVFMLLQGLGDSIGGPLRSLAILGPRDRFGSGPNGFTVNRTAAAAHIGRDTVGAAGRWRSARADAPCSCRARAAGDGAAHLRPADRLRGGMVDDAALVRRAHTRSVRRSSASGGQPTATATSLETNGVFSAATLATERGAGRAHAARAQVNGAPLSLDHGFPARIIGPALPGVHCTKWVAKVTFHEAQNAEARARAFPARYGASPLHLLAALASFAVIAVAVARMVRRTGRQPQIHPDLVRGRALAHDMRAAAALLGARPAGLIAARGPGVGRRRGRRRGALTPLGLHPRPAAAQRAAAARLRCRRSCAKATTTFHVASGQQQDVYLALPDPRRCAVRVSALAYVLTSGAGGVASPTRRGLPRRGSDVGSACATRASTSVMSRTARAVPRTVPVTFDRPVRGR